MGRFDIFDTIDDLRRTGDPFCVATVVRTADVTSAKAGAKAAVTEGGEIIGHLGGACVRRAVLAAGAQALVAGDTRVIRVKPSGKVVDIVDEDGAEVYKSGCPSGGTVDILIEPFRPPPLLVVFGVTPISRAVAEHGALAGYRVAVSSEMAFDHKAARFDGVDISSLGICAADFVVVASQGTRDLDALRAAIRSPARRISMVASRRKADVLCAKLQKEGLDAEDIARLKSPAGLDLGAIDPREIAISVIAELVQWRNLDRMTPTTDSAVAG